MVIWMTNKKMKVITICGSLKFKNEMFDIAGRMSFEGNCVLMPIFTAFTNNNITEEQISKLKEAHFKRIELSDVILVVNVNNYVGNSTKSEIEYAKKLDKEIVYYTDLK